MAEVENIEEERAAPLGSAWIASAHRHARFRLALALVLVGGALEWLVRPDPALYGWGNTWVVVTWAVDAGWVLCVTAMVVRVAGVAWLLGTRARASTPAGWGAAVLGSALVVPALIGAWFVVSLLVGWRGLPRDPEMWAQVVALELPRIVGWSLDAGDLRRSEAARDRQVEAGRRFHAYRIAGWGESSWVLAAATPRGALLRVEPVVVAESRATFEFDVGPPMVVPRDSGSDEDATWRGTVALVVDGRTLLAISNGDSRTSDVGRVVLGWDLREGRKLSTGEVCSLSPFATVGPDDSLGAGVASGLRTMLGTTHCPTAARLPLDRDALNPHVRRVVAELLAPL